MLVLPLGVRGRHGAGRATRKGFAPPAEGGIVSAVPDIRFDDKNVLVTGAANGIGRATALLFASRGGRMFLCDIDEKGLSETAELAKGYGYPVRTDRIDVSDREQMRTYAESIHGEVAALDVLVNNAGVGLAGGCLDTSLEDWDWVIGINLWGVIYGCHFFVPQMVERRAGGQVVNVSSAAGFVATADLAAYSTTKFAVFGLSEALRDELEPHGIGVSAICPGVINTTITRTARLRGARAEPGERERLVDMYKRRNYGPERVAQAILDAVAQNRAVVPVTPEAWVSYAMKRAAPELTTRMIRQLTQWQIRRSGGR